MTEPSVPAQKKGSMALSCRSLIFYMGKVANESSSSLAPLKKIVASKEFASLLKLLSRVGTQTMIKLLESASQDCAARKAENAKKINVRKRADTANYIPGSTKRVKLHETGGSCNHSKGTASCESGVSEQLSAHPEESNIQRLSEEGQTRSSLHKRNQARQQGLGLSRSRDLTSNAEDEDSTMLATGPDTAILPHSGPSSHGDNNSRPEVKTECHDSSSAFQENSGNSTQNPGQVEDDQFRTGERLQSAYEKGSKITTMGTAHPPEISGAKEKVLELDSWDTYKREVGIIRRDPEYITPIENHCCKAQGDKWNCHSGNPKRELSELLNTIEQLDFHLAKDQLVKYLTKRQAKMGIQPETPATWTMSEPQHVLGALRTIRAICDDANIHRAFAQMKLYLVIQQKLESGYKPIHSGKGKPRLPQRLYLEELARREAGTASEEEIKAIFHDYHSEYQAGRRWLEVADWFGGPGIVLVFITAGIGPFYVAAGWKLFQRHCLKYISQSLCSIKGLVGALGTDCLENYCRYGQLSQKHINSVIEYEGIIPPEEIEEDGSEMDETEDDTSGPEVHDANGVENGTRTSDSDSDEESGSDKDVSKHDHDAPKHGQKDLSAEEDDGMEE